MAQQILSLDKLVSKQGTVEEQFFSLLESGCEWLSASHVFTNKRLMPNSDVLTRPGNAAVYHRSEGKPLLYITEPSLNPFLQAEDQTGEAFQQKVRQLREGGYSLGKEDLQKIIEASEKTGGEATRVDLSRLRLVKGDDGTCSMHFDPRLHKYDLKGDRYKLFRALCWSGRDFGNTIGHLSMYCGHFNIRTLDPDNVIKMIPEGGALGYFCLLPRLGEGEIITFDDCRADGDSLAYGAPRGLLESGPKLPLVWNLKNALSYVEEHRGQLTYKQANRLAEVAAAKLHRER